MPGMRRRAFLQASIAAGGALLLGFRLPTAASASPKAGDTFAPNAFIRIDRQGGVTLIMPQVEMGQGVYTAVAMILAEELDVRWEQVRLEAAPPNDKLYGNPTFGIQVTGNSNSIRAFWMPLRKAAAGARAMLIEAAARRWKVGSGSCGAANSEVIHAASGRRLAYAALIDAASSIAGTRKLSRGFCDHHAARRANTISPASSGKNHGLTERFSHGKQLQSLPTSAWYRAPT